MKWRDGGWFEGEINGRYGWFPGETSLPFPAAHDGLCTAVFPDDETGERIGRSCARLDHLHRPHVRAIGIVVTAMLAEELEIIKFGSSICTNDGKG